MVIFKQKLDRNKKIYIPKPLRNAGFKDTLIIMPNYRAAVIYPVQTDLKEVERSLQILLEDLKHQIAVEATSGVR